MANLKYEDLKIINVDAKLREHRILYEKLDIPAYISDNLKYTFFDWQKIALENLLGYQLVKEIENPNSPTHLMFNLATGTGKTLLMASTILYYYKQGFRHFLFFVNQNNIVDKTENNFIDSSHHKYLFKEKIVIEDKIINIKKVDNFSENPQGIEIKFTTVQKLYTDIHKEKENQTTLEDLQKLDLVLLADEAHHLNANTKNIQIQLDAFEEELKGSSAEKEKKGWEHTVIEYILKKFDYQKGKYVANNKNVLLEFTATIPENQNIAKKYEDKIIYKFGLKEFLREGFTKEINLISSSLSKKERILHALLFSWYRHRIALKYGISNFKSVILFRSKTIEESKTDYEEFLYGIDTLSVEDFDFLRSISEKISQNKNPNEQANSRNEQVLQFIQNESILISEIIHWIKINYQEKNIIITNSKNNKTKIEKTEEETEKLLNSLEDKNNIIRGIFTVNRLTEGWDVLNLFDIVRLYETRDEGKDKAGNRKAGSSTISEKQLIGRGVRYFSFEFQDKIKNKRKFDDNQNHELRVLEELYFHSTNDPKYLYELKQELRKDGYLSNDKILKTFDLKPEFKESSFYKNTKIWYNKQIDNPNRKKKDLDFLKENFHFEYKLKGLKLNEQEVNFEKQEDTERLNLDEKGLKIIPKKFQEIEKHIVQKAIQIKANQEESFFQFEKLKIELDIKSIDDLQEKFLGDFKLKIIANKKLNYDDIDNKIKLDLVLKFLETIFAELKNHIHPKIGTQEFFASSFEKIFAVPKTKTIDEKNLDDNIAKNNHWYVLDAFVGTDQEKELIKFIKNTIGNFEEKYQEIYLLRNEEVYKIYDFEQGRGFQPDFLLFLKSKENALNYQVFIEPKQEKLMTSEDEIWKEEFLSEITEKFGFDKIIQAENPNYRLVGLPFFNKEKNEKFENAFNSLL